MGPIRLLLVSDPKPKNLIGGCLVDGGFVLNPTPRKVVVPPLFSLLMSLINLNISLTEMLVSRIIYVICMIKCRCREIIIYRKEGSKKMIYVDTKNLFKY
jgi:hypothetical protein